MAKSRYSGSIYLYGVPSVRGRLLLHTLPLLLLQSYVHLDALQLGHVGVQQQLQMQLSSAE